MAIKLVIFDNDGVLINSEIIWHQICVEEMTRLGYPLTIEQSLKLFSGISDVRTAVDILRDEFGSPDIKIDFYKVGQKTEACYPSLLKSVENIEHVLKFLDNKKIEKCVASNGDFDYIQRTLQITGLQAYFHDESIFGVQGNIKRKPAPDIFLKASHSFSISPEQCLVIEDHILGVKAAKEAKMKVIGFQGATHAKNDEHGRLMAQAKPDQIIKDANELLKVLKTHV